MREVEEWGGEGGARLQASTSSAAARKGEVSPDMAHSLGATSTDQFSGLFRLVCLRHRTRKEDNDTPLHPGGCRDGPVTISDRVAA